MSVDEIDDSSAPLLEHLKELRDRILISLAAFVVGIFIAFAVWNPIFNFLTAPICDALASRGQECQLVLIKLQEGFFVAFRISVMGGFIMAFPIIVTFSAAVTFGDIRYRAPAEIPLLLLAAVLVDARWRPAHRRPAVGSGPEPMAREDRGEVRR